MTDLFGEESTEVWCTDPGEEYVHESSLAVYVDSGICLRYEPNEDVMKKSSFPLPTFKRPLRDSTNL